MNQPNGPGLPDREPLDEDVLAEAHLTPLQLTVAGIAGLVSAGAGAVAVFETENEVGSAAMIAVGVYFLIAVIVRRFPKVKLGDNEIDPTARRIARQAERRSMRAVEDAADAAEDAADAKEGLRATTSGSEPPGSVTGEAVAPSLDPEIVELAGEYNRVRWTLPKGPSRTLRMTDIVERMVARFREVGGPDVLELLTSEDRGLRLAGVAAAYARPMADAIPALVQVSVTPDKPFNEIWALRALGRAIDGHCSELTDELRSRLKARLRVIPAGSDRDGEIRQILRNCP